MKRAGMFGKRQPPHPEVPAQTTVSQSGKHSEPGQWTHRPEQAGVGRAEKGQDRDRLGSVSGIREQVQGLGVARRGCRLWGASWKGNWVAVSGMVMGYWFPWLLVRIDNLGLPSQPERSTSCRNNDHSSIRICKEPSYLLSHNNRVQYTPSFSQQTLLTPY